MSSVAEAVENLRQLVASEPIRSLAAAFEEARYELALVGGPVRDAFLGREVHDLDFTTSATPDQVENLFVRSPRQYGMSGANLERLRVGSAMTRLK